MISAKTIKVVIGTPINSEHAYILDKFLENQKEIQQLYDGCELVLATSDKSYAQKLKNMLYSAQVKGKVITHDPIKPDYARHWIWDVTSGREAIRQYTVSQPEIEYLLFLDSDTLFEPTVVTTMIKSINGYDAVFNGCALREYGIGIAGAGCLMLNRYVLQKIRFHCYEFMNGEVIFEDNLLEMDLFRQNARIRKGIFVTTIHYQDANSFKRLEPQPISKIRKLINLPFIRYALIKSSIVLHYNIPWRMKVYLNKLNSDRKGSVT